MRRPLTVVTLGTLKAGNKNIHAAMDIYKHFKVAEQKANRIEKGHVIYIPQTWLFAEVCNSSFPSSGIH